MGMVVSNDIGSINDIHPKNKIDIARRLSLWALQKDYGQALEAYSGPLYEKSVFIKDQAIISFSHCGSGLMAGEKTGLAEPVETKKSLAGFQICGSDRKWRWAAAKIISTNEIVVRHEDVKKPQEVRYFWAWNIKGKVRLYNKQGLPASGFSTGQ